MRKCDILIVGGGPAGATLGALLARRGVSVRIIERSTFPRYQIGESLIPQALDILEESGALPTVEAYGFLRKEGGVFRWGQNEKPWAFYFDEVKERYRHTYAYQVIRADFDRILLDHARECGANVDEEMTAQELSVKEFSRFRYGVSVTAANAKGIVQQYDARLVVDCSGQAGWLARQFGWREFDQDFRNLAIHTYFRGAKRLDGRDVNAIFCEATCDGWFWNIPLHDGTNSVGLVTTAVKRSSNSVRAESRFDDALCRSTFLKEQVQDAKIVAPMRIQRDYSYRSRGLWNSGCVIVGDAGNFIDPIWSTGVFLAMSGAVMAAAAIRSWLSTGDLDCFEKYEHDTNCLVDVYREFVRYFYGGHVDQESVFWKARSLSGSRINERDAFIRLVSGRLGAA